MAAHDQSIDAGSATIAPLVDHVVPWPRNEQQWRALTQCDTCGLLLLRQFIESSTWVVRRVESIAFLDDRTVRRRVSLDFTSPRPSLLFESEAHDRVFLLPLAIMRRKSLVNFDLRGHDGQPMSLAGLRENQALTLAIVRAWAKATLCTDALDPDIGDFLEDVVYGDQTELTEAYHTLRSSRSGQLASLRERPEFRAVIDRLAESFILIALNSAGHLGRQIIKFSYDEPLTLRYREAGYRPGGISVRGRAATTGEAPGAIDKAPTYEEGPYLRPWRAAPLLARLGLTPTLIRFPVPAAELAASFHFEVRAPNEVSIVRARILGGRPRAAPPARYSRRDDSDGDRDGRRVRRRHESEWLPSFDDVAGGYPTVDLHIADVPYGSLSRAQVALQANPKGWRSTAVLSSWLASATLADAWLARNARSDVGSTILVTFAAALVAVLARPDRHRMITRLLATIRLLAAVSATVTFAGALVFAFVSATGARAAALEALFFLSLPPAVMATLAWATATARLESRARRSPWEQLVRRTRTIRGKITTGSGTPASCASAGRQTGPITARSHSLGSTSRRSRSPRRRALGGHSISTPGCSTRSSKCCLCASMLRTRISSDDWRTCTPPHVPSTGNRDCAGPIDGRRVHSSCCRSKMPWRSLHQAYTQRLSPSTRPEGRRWHLDDSAFHAER